MNAFHCSRKHILAACFISCLLVLPIARAGGLIGDIINVVSPGTGTKLDDVHRQIKEAIPPYKSIEEAASKTVNESFVQAGAPLLQELIARSRDDALNAGVQPIPFEIRRNLTGFIPDQVLNAARYRVQGGSDLSLQVNSIRYGEANAITLDYVIVFKNANDALYNITLWAHELTHLGQYQRWGIRDFSIKYLRDYQSVEREAYEAETRYIAWAVFKNNGQTISSLEGNSSTCGTAITACKVNGSASVGTPCWCPTPIGPATGSLIPSISPAIQGQSSQQWPPAGFPSGYGMQVCGCWGPNPPPTAPEQRCASGSVRINVCPSMCAPGHPAYAYVCM